MIDAASHTHKFTSTYDTPMHTSQRVQGYTKNDRITKLSHLVGDISERP